MAAPSPRRPPHHASRTTRTAFPPTQAPPVASVHGPLPTARVWNRRETPAATAFCRALGSGAAAAEQEGFARVRVPGLRVGCAPHPPAGRVAASRAVALRNSQRGAQECALDTPGPRSQAGLQWLARVGASSGEPLALVMSWSRPGRHTGERLADGTGDTSACRSVAARFPRSATPSSRRCGGRRATPTVGDPDAV
jgi:hypothetical protein